MALYSTSNATSLGTTGSCNYTAPQGAFLVFFLGRTSLGGTPSINGVPLTFVINTALGSPGGALGCWIMKNPPAGGTIDVVFSSDPGAGWGMCTEVHTGVNNYEAAIVNPSTFFNKADVTITTVTDNDTVVTGVLASSPGSAFVNPTGYTTGVSEFGNLSGSIMATAYKDSVTPAGAQALEWTWSGFNSQGFTIALGLIPGIIPIDNGLFIISD